MQDNSVIITENIIPLLNRKKRKAAQYYLKQDYPPRKFCYSLFTNNQLHSFFTKEILEKELSDENVEANFKLIYDFIKERVKK